MKNLVKFVKILIFYEMVLLLQEPVASVETQDTWIFIIYTYKEINIFLRINLLKIKFDNQWYLFS